MAIESILNDVYEVRDDLGVLPDAYVPHPDQRINRLDANRGAAAEQDDDEECREAFSHLPFPYPLK